LTIVPKTFCDGVASCEKAMFLANSIKKKTTKYLIFGFKTLKVIKHNRYSVVYPYNYKKINKLR